MNQPTKLKPTGGVSKYIAVAAETTGYGPQDHITEIGCVTIFNGETVDEYETLIHTPNTTTPQTLTAPTFEQIAPDIAMRLDGGIITAHNLPRINQALTTETERLPAESYYDPGTGICTWQISKLKLPQAATHIGLTPPQPGALNEARTIAQLLKHHGTGNTQPTPLTFITTGQPHGITVRNTNTTRKGSLHEIIARTTWPNPPTNTAALYLDAIDRCLDDRTITQHEQTWLTQTAENLNINPTTQHKLHQQYYQQLKKQILTDTTVTDQEQTLADQIATTLGLPTEPLLPTTGGPQHVNTNIKINQNTQIWFEPNITLADNPIPPQALQKLATDNNLKTTNKNPNLIITTTGQPHPQHPNTPTLSITRFLDHLK